MRTEYRDGRFWRDGEPFFVVAADYQYYRERREHWVDRLEKLRASGVNTITLYVPWRHHLRVAADGQRTYDFTGETLDSRDVVGFMKTIKSLDLLMIAKPGPFVHSELNIGGLPDIVSPSFNEDMPPAERHHGGPAYWTYDATQLPAPLGERFNALAIEWLEAARDVLRPFAANDGPLIAVQLNDETIFCTATDPPWHFGFEPDGMRYFHGLLAERYGDVETYNRLHATAHVSLDDVPSPRLEVIGESPSEQDPPGPRTREDALGLVDWAEYQWRLRRDLYDRYRRALDIDVPYVTNFAGITPPIEENVPDLQEHAAEAPPSDFAGLYPEWWLAMNRIDADTDVYEYGMISWLGVASYDRDVFDRYVNTARRARGINMEENWGFGMLYDARSRHPLVPFYQTLVSVAAGCSGYVIFCGVSTDYWDDDLDRVTKKQCSTFPSHAPIDEHGECRPMYSTATLLNRWFVDNGAAFLRCEIDVDAAYLLHAPYAAISSWVPDGRYWGVEGHEIPRCGREGFEEFSHSLQEAGYSFAMFEIDAVAPERLRSPRALAMHTAFFMDEPVQRKLVDFIEADGTIILSGELPVVDLRWQPCTLLRDAVHAASAKGGRKVVYREENFFADGQFAAVLAGAGLRPTLRYSENLRAYVHRGDIESFLFFFGFDIGDSNTGWIELDSQRIELELGSKTSGALRIRDGHIVSWLVKGVNEVEETRSRISIRFGDQVIEGVGDFSG